MRRAHLRNRRGRRTEDAIDVYPAPLAQRQVKLRGEKIKSLTSIDVESSEATRILTALGFVPSEVANGTTTYSIPSWRGDVAIEEDLIEEVARHAGYDKIGSELPPSSIAGEYQPAEMKRRDLRRVLRNQGFDEAINFSFIEARHDDEFEPLPGMKDSFVHAQESDFGGSREDAHRRCCGTAAVG